MSNDWKSRAKKVEESDWKSRSKIVENDFPTKDESSPEISFKERLIAKNLAQSTAKQAEYLKLQHPDLDIKVNGNNVLIKRREDPEYKVLDSSKLEWEDISDIGDQVASGVTSTLGTTAGALAGPVGAFAGAAVAGGATEYLRQKLGQALGVPQEVDGGDVATSAAANTLGVGLLGTGKMAGKAAAGEYQGLIRQAWNKGVPKAASYWFGAPEKVINKYVDERELVNSVAKSKTEHAGSIVDRLRSALNNQKKQVGGALESEIDTAGKAVNLRNAKIQMDDIVKSAKAEYDAFPNQLNKEKLDDAVKAYSSLFEGPTGALPDEVTATQAFGIQQDLKDFADLKRISGGINSRHAATATQAEKNLSDSALNSYRAVGNELDRVTSGASPQLKSQYKELVEMQSNLSPALKNDQQAYSTFTNLDGKSKTAFRENLEKLAQKSGENFEDDITTLQAAEYFGDAGWMPKSVGGTTSTSRSLPAVALLGLVGAKVGSSMGPNGAIAGLGAGIAAGNAVSSPKMLKSAINYSDALRNGANALGQVYTPYVVPVRESLVQSSWDGM
jgi:hypothetical protein